MNAIPSRLMLLVMWLALAWDVQTASSHPHPTFEPCPDVKLTLRGPVGAYCDAVITNWLLHAPKDNPAMLEMYADRDSKPYRDLLPWSGEFAGKYLTSVAQVLPMSKTDRLQKQTAAFVQQLISQQASDGYLGPFPEEYRLTGKAPNVDSNRTWDAWGHYHVMIGLLLWSDRTGDREALEAAQRIGDLLCNKFLSTGTKISSIGSAEMNQAVVHSLALLYQRFQQDRYLRLAQFTVEDFKSPGAGDYLEAGLRGTEFYQLPKPRWESLHSLMGLAELYWITGNEDYRKAFEHFWWSIAKLDRHNNGGFSSGEQAQGDPYHPGAIETCCTVAWMAMSVDMLRLTGNSPVADELELSTLNQAIALHSPSGRWCTYNTPMDGRRIPSTEDIAFQIRPGSEELNCCSINSARSLGMISDWAVMRDADGLVLNWYGPSTIETEVKDVQVKLSQETSYPAEGNIRLNVEVAQPVDFVLKLRIPRWSEETTVSVDGEPLSATAGSYLAIDRKWSGSSEVRINFDMSLRYWVGERECSGNASIYRGPLLLAYEHAESAPAVFSDEWTAFGHFRSTNERGATVTFTFEGDAVEWHGLYFDDAGKTRVIIDDKQVDVVDQYGPRSGDPFVWSRKGLGERRHVIRLEVLGEKSPTSKNVWANVRELKAPKPLPEIDSAVTGTLVEGGVPEPCFAILEVEDTSGQSVRLRDFGTIGQDRKSYSSWLPVRGVHAVPFSRDNPSRTSRPGE